MSKAVVVTGAAGFLGYALTERLLQKGYRVYAVVRPGSGHNNRLLELENDNLSIIELEIKNFSNISAYIREKCSCFFHLAWSGDNTIGEQIKNIDYTLQALKTAKDLGCVRYICTGSQAEYGIVPPNEIVLESRNPIPITAYGSVKVCACVLSRQYAKELGIEWIWGRVFSLIGKNEPQGRMLPDLVKALSEGHRFYLSSCTQNWDYLDVYDGAEALIALADKGRSNEIYNIARGDYRVLSTYIKEAVKSLNASQEQIKFGAEPNPYISLQPSVKKLINDTGWAPRVSFTESLKQY